MGNLNVGKSTLFSRLTGINVIISNYPGTTVEFKKGKMKLGREIVEVIDVPGTYTLEPISKAEIVAVKMLKEGDLIINVIDATNLERNLYLTLELLEKNKPMIVALNCWDEARHKGIKINIKKLQKLLGVPVIPTVALTGEGIKKLVSYLKKARKNPIKLKRKEKWAFIGKIVKEVQKIRHKDHTFLEIAEDLTIKPLTGIPVGTVILILSFFVVRFIGESLSRIFDYLFNFYTPIANWLGNHLSGFLKEILIGTLIDGKIDYLQSMGLLTTGIYVPIAVVLPYIISFYFVLGLLEDSGYLPRLATLVDTILHKLGMHGLAIIPMLLGLGCNVPGALSTRILETRRQRFIAATLMAIAVPCMAQTAMIFAILAPYGIKRIGIIFATLFIIWLILGILLNNILPGGTPETFMEIPPYRIPYFKGVLKKLWMRTKGFIFHALPFVFLGVLAMNILYTTGIISAIAKISSPIVVKLLGLPKEAIAALIVGFLRKDVAVGMLLPLRLNLKQLIIACTILTIYFPCIATFVTLLKELGIKDMIKSAIIMMVTSILVGSFLNIIL